MTEQNLTEQTFAALTALDGAASKALASRADHVTIQQATKVLRLALVELDELRGRQNAEAELSDTETQS